MREEALAKLMECSPGPLPDLLRDLVPPAWMRNARCRAWPELPWVPGRGESTAEAKAVCAHCLVREECLAYAVEHDLRGVRGGTSDRERRRLRAGRAA